MSRDQTFLYVLGAAFAFLVLFGLAATILAIVGDPSDTVTLRVLGAIGSMFSSIIGLILGYMVGKRTNGN